MARIPISLILTGCVASILLRSIAADDPPNGDQPELTGKLRNLMRVTSHPVNLRPAVAMASASPDMLRRKDHGDLVPKKQDTVAHVFVSRDGWEVMKRRDATQFPVGAIILKQKFEEKVAQNPVLYTGMLKREKGYNPECGNWEFFTLSDDGQRVTSRGQLESCMACHKEYARTDFVTKQYPMER